MKNISRFNLKKLKKFNVLIASKLLELFLDFAIETNFLHYKTLNFFSTLCNIPSLFNSIFNQTWQFFDFWCHDTKGHKIKNNTK